MSPSTRLIPLAGLLILLSACGEPPQPPLTSPPLATGSAASAPSVVPVLPTTVATQPLPATPPTVLPPPTYPTYTARTTRPTTTTPTTRSPTPTPSHAPRCAGEPTGAQILALIKGQPGVPDQPLKVVQGPLCAGDWSFTTVEITGQDEDELEPLMVLATGKADTLALVGAGSDVCSNQVQADAPPGVRVLACGS
ncbi:hypothetical protein ACWKSP_21400 [Micromonosporaceae bacterium Da 78-11]